MHDAAFIAIDSMRDAIHFDPVTQSLQRRRRRGSAGPKPVSQYSNCTQPVDVSIDARSIYLHTVLLRAQPINLRASMSARR